MKNAIYHTWIYLETWTSALGGHISRSSFRSPASVNGVVRRNRVRVDVRGVAMHEDRQVALLLY